MDFFWHSDSDYKTHIVVGKGGYPPFSRIPPPFLEIQDVPTFDRFIQKTKELNNSCNQFVYLYIISILKVS